MAVPRSRTGAVLAVLAICAAPAGLAAPPAPPGASPAPAAVALRAAGAATASELAGGAAELPGRAHLALARSAETALAELPAEPLARARAWQDELLAWRDAARSAARAATLLSAASSAAGGALAAVDRALDAAALLALAAIGLHLALRPRPAARR